MACRPRRKRSPVDGAGRLTRRRSRARWRRRRRPEVELAPTFPIATAPAATIAPANNVAPTIAPAAAAAGVVVPNLYGQTIGGAMSAILPLGLRITQDQPRCSSSIPLNAVAAQDPPAGTTVAPGTAIRVSLSRGTLMCPAADQP